MEDIRDNDALKRFVSEVRTVTVGATAGRDETAEMSEETHGHESHPGHSQPMPGFGQPGHHHQH